MLDKLNTIKGKLLLAFLALALIPVIILGYLGINEIKKLTKNNFINSTQKEIEQADKAINLYFKNVKENCNYLANNNVIKQADDTITSYMNKTEDEKLKLTPMKNGGIEAEIYSVYKNFADTHPGSAYVYMATTKGEYIQWPANSVPKKYDPKERPYYKIAMKNKGEVTRTKPYYWSADDRVIVSTVTTIEDESGEVIGVQGLDVSLKGLTDMIKNIKIGKTGYLILTTSDGTILADPAHSDLNFKNIDKLGSEKLASISKIKEDNFFTEIDGKKHFVNIYTSPKTGWKFIAVIESQELLSKINTCYKIIGGVLLASIILILVFSLSFIKKFSTPLLEAVNFTEKIADGKLNIPSLEIDKSDEVGQLRTSLNKMQTNLKDMVSDVLETVEELSAYSQELSASSEEGNATVETTNELIEDMSVNLEQISASSQEVASFAQESETKTEIGTEKMSNALESINQISRSVSDAVEVMGELEETSQEIEEAAKLITDIAEQTNLLALNAAIEAARAGSGRAENSNAGQGFTVVAEEIRELAGETNQATEKIRGLIEETQSKVEKGRQTVKEADQKVESGYAMIKEADEIFSEIQQTTEQTTEQIEQTAASAQDAAGKSEQVNNAAEDVESMSEEITDSAQELAAMAQKLRQLVDRFEI